MFWQGFWYICATRDRASDPFSAQKIKLPMLFHPFIIIIHLLRSPRNMILLIWLFSIGFIRHYHPDIRPGIWYQIWYQYHFLYLIHQLFDIWYININYLISNWRFDINFLIHQNLIHQITDFDIWCINFGSKYLIHQFAEFDTSILSQPEGVGLRAEYINLLMIFDPFWYFRGVFRPNRSFP